MGICWYCYWGWSKPVAEIYQAALAKLDGDDGPLHFGPAHIVWEDENFNDECVDFCLNDFDKFKHGFSDEDLAIVRWSLEEIRKIPESIRACEPADYDDEHPDLFPPACEVVKVYR